MNEPTVDRWAENLTATARALPYPPTPNLAALAAPRLAQPPARLAARPWQVALIVSVLLVLAALLAVPPVRAALLDVLRIGAVRIFLVPPTPTPTLVPVPTSTGTPAPVATPRPEPSSTPTPLASVLDLAGQTTLADARSRATFPVALPAYPSDLGQPERVFVQDMGAPVVVLAWLDPHDPSRVRLSLHEIGPGSWALGKMGFSKVGFTKEGLANAGLALIDLATVNGQTAVWVQGPHLLIAGDGQIEPKRLVTGNTLIWVDNNGVTYRLETELALSEAVKIAESLR